MLKVTSTALCMLLPNPIKKAVHCFLCLLFFLFSFHSLAQNPVADENLLPGTPASIWDISGAGDLSIQGFASDISVNKGSTIQFKINVTGAPTNYGIRIYRMGYYQGNGAREVANLGSFVSVSQPAPVSDPATGLVDCGNWAVSASWAVPSSAVSGIYFAKLTRADNSGASHVVFIVRDDAGNADLLFKTSDATWQAYNIYGGKSLYTGTGGKASKVSYNRPFLTRAGGGGGGASEDWVFNAEYPMVRWLERNGYNVSYTTDVDMDRDVSVIAPSKHRVLLSVGHDEYWSLAERTKFETARANGVHLAFFSGNEVYWKTRWENSIDGSNTPNRTLVCYKEGATGENQCGGKCDPLPNVWTGLWRDGCSPTYAANDGCKPENALTGQISWVDNTSSITVPFAYKDYRIWRNTSIPSLTSGQVATFTAGTLGYEWDAETPAFSSFYPNGRILMSETNAAGKTHKLSLYKHSSGALVFGAGTVQWSWGLDANHDRGSAPADVRMQQATVNLLADMNVQPATLQAGLVAATASTDATAPVTTINTPLQNAIITQGLPVTVSGVATDAATVAGVEISVDGGVTWVPATGTNNWSYTFTPASTGTVTIRSRGFDDSGNMEGAGTAPSANAKTITVQGLPNPNEGPGGPVLVISNNANPFSRYTTEILRAEGLNEFAVMDITAVTPTVLNNYDVVVLGEVSVTAGQVNMFTDWVNAGGLFIALRPDVQFANLFGITPAAGTVNNQYLLINTSAVQGAGLVNETIQFHGTADLYTLNGASALATLYSTATTATTHPAVTINTVGANGGKAIAFTFDLNKSIVYTRQGNPAWAGDERDGQSGPIRSNDLFFGAKAGDLQTDWVDFNKIQIPQADEQQRLLANIILLGNRHKKPLPRFWYLPRNLKAAVVMTGDDHANGATAARFNQYIALSPSNTQQAVDDWIAIRGSSYIYPNTPLSSTQVAGYQAQGFEIGLHLNTGCTNYTGASLLNDFNTQLPQLLSAFPGLTSPVTHRTHCISWSDWSTKPKTEVQKGIRLNTDYYYWPASWIQDRPGLFTGSGMPMRFADVDGTLIDNYQLTTQLTDESGQSLSTHINTLIDNAVGVKGYYGVFCANMHTDNHPSSGSDEIINAAVSKNIPVISAKQMLTWLDGRNNSSFGSFTWNNNQLSFTIDAYAGAGNLKAMLPRYTGETNGLLLQSVTRNGTPLTLTYETIKGIAYAFFDGTDGAYTASYVANTCVAPNATLIASASAVCPGTEVSLQLASATGTSPYSIVVNGKTYNNVTPGIAFANFVPGEISIWDNSVTGGEPVNVDNSAVELGMKFRSSAAGYVTGVRFYKRANNTGTHTGRLWSSTGALLADVTFTNETASGWQQAKFSNPVNIQANTTYIVSYHAPNGQYAFTENGFQLAGITNGSLTALQSGVDGLNGVYKYGAGGVFPNESFNNANYWVDVLFVPTNSSQTLSYTLSRIVDNNNCENTGPVISTASVTLNPIPAGTIATEAPGVCSGDNVKLVYNASNPNNGPFQLTVNGTLFTNVISGVPFNTGIKGAVSNSIWDNSTVPANPSVSDNSAVELGVKFRSSIAGSISAIRFYKGNSVNAAYTVRLWSTGGTLLGTAAITTNAVGWQVVNFSSPISILANTTYVASYHTPIGLYAANGGFFTSSGVTQGPLTALQNGVDGPNGVFQYGSGGVFPTNSFNGGNYWADVVFTAGTSSFTLTNVTDNNGCVNNSTVAIPVTVINCGPLPVQLLSFNVTAANNDAFLRWTTATELNNKGFEVQRSKDAVSWETIGFVNGAGNSSSTMHYNYIDKLLPKGKYYYRLVQVDFDGKKTISDIRNIIISGTSGYELKQNFPNPFSQHTTIEFILPQQKKINLAVYDLNGKLIKTILSENRSQGYHQIQFSAGGLSSGVYYLKFETDDFQTFKKMVIQH
jgi:Domain of unknown function (DUF4082)/Secretion system C-terminal sorting domain/Bacterial Ig domain